MGSSPVIPPPPPGFSIIPSGGVPPPPPGFTLIGTAQAAPTGPPAPPQSSMFGQGGMGWDAAAPRREGALKAVLSMLTGVYDTANLGPRDVAPGLFPAPQRTLTDVIMNRGPQEPPRQMTAREILQADPSNPSAPNITPTPDEQGGYTAANIAAFLAPTPAGKYGLLAQAAQSGLMTHLQGGTPLEALTSAVTAGLVPPVINKTAGALERAAVTQYERALGATAGPMKEAAARIAPELIERGVTGGLGSIAAKGTKESDEVGAVIRQTYDAATQRGVTTSTAPATANLQALRDKYVTPGKSGPVVTNPTAVGRIDTILKMLEDIGPTATPNQLWQVRKNLDEIIGPNGFGQGLTKGTAKKIEKAARTGLQAELDKADPTVRAINKEYGFWEDVEKVATSTQRRRVSQESPLATLMFGAAGAGSGYMQGGDLSDAALGGVLMGSAARGAKTPFVRTHSAVAADRAGDALRASQEPLAKLLAALFGGASSR